MDLFEAVEWLRNDDGRTMSLKSVRREVTVDTICPPYVLNLFPARCSVFHFQTNYDIESF